MKRIRYSLNTRLEPTATDANADVAYQDTDQLPVGARLEGPAIVTEDETSTLIGPGWTATINTLGYIELTREAA